jgi:radical SAM protein with 4Fe4S-binding SPASM domain
MLPCGLLPTLTMGNIVEESLGTDYLPDNRLPIKNSSACSPCIYFSCCKGCRALALANSGGLYDKDPQCWVTLP